MIRSFQGGSVTPECQQTIFIQLAHFNRNPTFLYHLDIFRNHNFEVAQFAPESWLTLDRNIQAVYTW